VCVCVCVYAPGMVTCDYISQVVRGIWSCFEVVRRRNNLKSTALISMASLGAVLSYAKLVWSMVVLNAVNSFIWFMIRYQNRCITFQQN
jgi:hypothetical protein